MNILAAPNSMKGSLNAFDFSDAIEKAFLDVSGSFRVKKVPVADGGDLTGEILCKVLNAETVQTVAHDPLGREITRRKLSRIRNLLFLLQSPWTNWKSS